MEFLKKVNIAHNLDDVELEEILEKALKNIRKKTENPDSPLKDKVSEDIRNESFKLFEKITDNMMKEINGVLKRK